MDSSRLNLLNQKELLRQQLADIELDLQYCTPTRMLSGDDESEQCELITKDYAPTGIVFYMIGESRSSSRNPLAMASTSTID